MEFDLNAVFGGNIRNCLKAVSKGIRTRKQKRKEIARSGVSTYAVDAELDALTFGAWVLQHSAKHMRQGREPWLNGYPWLGRKTHDNFAGSLFL